VVAINKPLKTIKAPIRDSESFMTVLKYKGSSENSGKWYSIHDYQNQKYPIELILVSRIGQITHMSFSRL
jgi:hypothetical protein